MNWKFWISKEKQLKKEYPEQKKEYPEHLKKCEKCNYEVLIPAGDTKIFHHCESCGGHFGASSEGNPDGVAFCPHCENICQISEPYCPDIYGNHWTPEEWDRMHGD